MTEKQRQAFVGMNALDARQLINADGESCPSVTGGKLMSRDNGDPQWFISCSDGSRYFVFWRADIGRIKALSYP